MLSGESTADVGLPGPRPSSPSEPPCASSTVPVKLGCRTSAAARSVLGISRDILKFSERLTVNYPGKAT
eukprot:707558-Pyramimonas_sp.AAC.1